MRFLCSACRTVLTADPGQEVDCPVCRLRCKAPDSAVAPGAVVGDFAIVRELARGGMGIVFLARQISLDRMVALKVLQDSYAADAQFVEDFIREARAAAKISHPNIVQAYAVGEENSVYYFAMELLDGDTMKSVLKKETKIEPRRAAEIICKVADALDFAWTEQRMVHQDIKPDNIMLTRRGQVKLADLGLARIATGSSNLMGDDEAEVMGTPQYISPEQLTGVETDIRSDLYSLGATFYHFVTGEFPYKGKDGNEIARQHVEGTLIPPAEEVPGLPAELNRIILRMMEKDRNNRYQTGAELVADLKNFLEGKSSAASPAAAPVSTAAPKIGSPAAPKIGSPAAPKIGSPAAPKIGSPAAPVKPTVLKAEPPPTEKKESPKDGAAKAEEPEKNGGKIQLKAKTEPESSPAVAEPPAGSSKKKSFPGWIKWLLIGAAVLIVIPPAVFAGMIRFQKLPGFLVPLQNRILAGLKLTVQDGQVVSIADAGKTEAPDPAGKIEKAGKTEKAAKAGKTEKVAKAGKTEKAAKAGKTEKAAKAGDKPAVPVKPAEAGDKPAVPVKPAEAPLPPPRTRPEFIRQAKALLELSAQGNIDPFLAGADDLMLKYPRAVTSEEESLQKRLLEVFGVNDEAMRVAPYRQTAHEKRVAAQLAMEEKLAKAEEESRRRQEEALRIAQENQRRQEDAIQRRKQEEQARLEGLKPRVDAYVAKKQQECLALGAAFISELGNPDQTRWNACRQAAGNFGVLPADVQPQEREAAKQAADFAGTLDRDYDTASRLKKMLSDPEFLKNIQIEVRVQSYLVGFEKPFRVRTRSIVGEADEVFLDLRKGHSRDVLLNRFLLNSEIDRLYTAFAKQAASPVEKRSPGRESAREYRRLRRVMLSEHFYLFMEDYAHLLNDRRIPKARREFWGNILNKYFVYRMQHGSAAERKELQDKYGSLPVFPKESGK